MLLYMDPQRLPLTEFLQGFQGSGLFRVALNGSAKVPLRRFPSVIFRVLDCSAPSFDVLCRCFKVRGSLKGAPTRSLVDPLLKEPLRVFRVQGLNRLL